MSVTPTEKVAKIQDIQCWNCNHHMSLKQRSAADGFCPKCDAEIDLNEAPYLTSSSQ